LRRDAEGGRISTNATLSRGQRHRKPDRTLATEQSSKLSRTVKLWPANFAIWAPLKFG